MGLSVVWFKRDLRWRAHAPLARALARGPVLCIYVVEPSQWASPDAALQHVRFVQESAEDLAAALRQRGGALHLLQGEMPGVLDALWAALPFERLYSHQETGHGLSFARDRAVARWCREHGVQWDEPPHFAVVRRLQDRDDWQAAAEAFFETPPEPFPPVADWRFAEWPAAGPARTEWAHLADMPIGHGAEAASWDPPARQRGGRQAGVAVLTEFLAERSASYRGGISSPLSAPTACSRLSPYLAYGCLGLQEVMQATQRRIASLPAQADRQRKGLESFVSRLHWHSHFIQRLESEPAMEWENLHMGYDGLRDPQAHPERLLALREGRTGWPLVDACVAMLRHTGWLNFRMRAMLVSVAAYPLWLHWRPVGEWLATQFLDYEPGIHWSQLQMQSGTTGINVPRIYNPIKQAQDHDPRGVFVRRWLPVLRRVPDVWLFEPWRMPATVQQRCGVIVGRDWPEPLVDLEAATREAKQRLFTWRAQPAVRAAIGGVVQRHGSRLRRQEFASGRMTRPPAEAAPQLPFDF